jgi:hypothetical protein
MNKRQVFLLWIVAIVLGGAIAFLKLGRKQAVAETTDRTRGQTVFAAFPINKVAALEIKGVGQPLNLIRKDGNWTIAERDNYPANTATINTLLRTIEELKVGDGIQVGNSFLPRFGLDESASAIDKHGYILTFKDADGKELAKLALDQRKAPEDDDAGPMGGGYVKDRYVRNFADTSGVYRVSETFMAVTDDPKRWLADDFIQIEKLKSITVTQPDKTDPAWKLSRETEEGAFVLDGAAAGETLDTAATDPLKSIFSYARPEDVIPAAKIAERVDSQGRRTATIETFEGLTYTITITPLKAAVTPPQALADPNNPPPPASESYALTVEVKGELPKERKKEANETAEDAKAKDAAFAERSKTLGERLAKEKALAGRTFEVPKYTVDALLKDRASLIKKETPPPAPETTPGTPGAQGNPPPTGPIEAVTDPIAVPPLPDMTPEGPPADPAPPPAPDTTPPATPEIAPAAPETPPAALETAPAKPETAE